MFYFHYSDTGLALTKRFEGLRLEAYRDSGGRLTIGYGHTGADVHEGMVITPLQAEILLRSDLKAAIDCVNLAVTYPALRQCQFDPLVDFAYNVGRASFLRSSLLARLNRGDLPGAQRSFSDWTQCEGQVVQGLVRRRNAEAELFGQAA